jgi:hypothetical protein
MRLSAQFLTHVTSLFCMHRSIALSMCCLMCFSSSALAVPEVDPVDGPHVDLKLSLEPDALRMQVTMNIVFLDEALEFERELPDRIDPAEGPALLDALQKWADDDLVADIDGVPVNPIVDGLLINDPETTFLALMVRTGMRGLRKIRFDVEWPLKSEPADISLQWYVYPDDPFSSLDPPEPITIAAEAQVEGIREAVFFSKEAPVWSWRSGSTAISERLEAIAPPESRVPWSVPMLSVVVGFFALVSSILLLASRRSGSSLVAFLILSCAALVAYAGSGVAVVQVQPPGNERLRLPTTAEGEAILVPLHGNIYRAFDYVAETDIYDALDRSVSGDLLDELYRTIYASLVMEEAQGAVSRVTAVRPVEVQIDSIAPDPVEPEILMKVTYRWQVDGNVTHWGHVHERTNEYLAELGVRGSEEGWRIESVRILEQERIDEPEDEVPPDGLMEFDDSDDDFVL